MACTGRSRSPPTTNRTLPIRTRSSLVQKGIVAPVTAEGTIAPSIDEYRKAGETIRERWTEEQRQRIAENEALLHQIGEMAPKIGTLSIKTRLPRGNELSVEEQIAIIHGGAGQSPNENTREALLERQDRNVIDNTNPIPPVPGARSSDPQTNNKSQIQPEQTSRLEWDDCPELDAKYGIPTVAGSSKGLKPALTLRTPPKSPVVQRQSRDFLNTSSPLCTGPCPIQSPHNQGAYLQRGQVPRVWNTRWGYSDPPREIWEAWVRIEQGRGRTWDQVEVDGFAVSHSWDGA